MDFHRHAGSCDYFVASMAYNMQVAFATTVVGLFSAAIGFVTKQTKNRWYAEDMSNLEFMAELVSEERRVKNEESNSNNK